MRYLKDMPRRGDLYVASQPKNAFIVLEVYEQFNGTWSVKAIQLKGSKPFVVQWSFNMSTWRNTYDHWTRVSLGEA